MSSVKYLLAFGFFYLASASAQAAVEVKEVVSPGGIKAWLVEEHSLPLIAVRIAFTGSGTAYDPPGKEGRTGMVSALLTEGAGDLDARAFNEALENNAIRLNFSADEDVFNASLQTLSEKKAEAFSYLGLALSKPRFDDAAVSLVKNQTLTALLQEEKEPGYLLERGWQHMAFGNHPYANPALGTRQSVSAMPALELRDYAGHYLTRQNMLVAVVGDITPSELAALLDKSFGALPKHYEPDVILKDVMPPLKGKEQSIEADIPQTMVVFGSRGLKRDDKDYYAGFVMNDILGGGSGLTSRLASEIREKRGLAYSVSSELEPMMHSALWEGQFATRSEEAATAVATLKTTLADFVRKGASAGEVEDAKRYLTGSFVLALGSNGNVAGYLISMQLYHLGKDYLLKRNGLIGAVTQGEVNGVARRLIDPQNLLIVMVGKTKATAH